jgi:hypothetical protein
MRKTLLLTAVVLGLALGMTWAVSLSAQGPAERWPMAWTPHFEELTPDRPGADGTTVLRNQPAFGFILPFEEIVFPKQGVGPKADGATNTFLIGQPGVNSFYIVLRVWGPGRHMGEDAQHWHREMRPEVMLFGHGYSIGFNKTFDEKVRQNVGPGDGFVELPGGRHFGFSDYPEIAKTNPGNNVMFVWGTEQIVSEASNSPNSKDHGWVYQHDKIQYEEAVGTGPKVWRFIGDSRKGKKGGAQPAPANGGYWSEMQKWGPGSGLIGQVNDDDRYGVVVTGTMYLSFGVTPGTRRDGLPFRRMLPGTFFAIPRGVGYSIKAAPDASDDAVVFLTGRSGSAAPKSTSY